MIVVDGPAGEVYGLYDLGSGLLESAHFSVTPARIGSLTKIAALFDFRFSEPSVDIDNIRVDVNVIPEPSSALLISAGVFVLAFVRFNARKHLLINR
jgi:hypothetical protein